MGHLPLAQPISTLAPAGLSIDASECFGTVQKLRSYSLQIDCKAAVTGATFCVLDTGFGRFFPIFIGATCDLCYGGGTAASFQMGTTAQGTQTFVNTTFTNISVGTFGSGQYQTTSLMRSDGTLRLSAPAGATVTYSIPVGSTATFDKRTIIILGVYIQ